jgi:electron-transferring-flavoprotein dehydrogenase
MDVDIVCVGFGPAMGGFLHTIAPKLAEMETPPTVICYERADGLGFGVSGVVTKARGIRTSFPDLNPAQIPMAAPVIEEKLLYLLDPHGASRRYFAVRALDAMARIAGAGATHAIALPWIPGFLHKEGGLVLSIGQFNQWAGEQLMTAGAVQLWPGMPVSDPLIEREAVVGVRLADQCGEPGMDIRAALTVVADGPVGPVGRRLDQHFGVPPGFASNDWALGSKIVVELPDNTSLEPGTVFHTIGFPEPDIFGFLYVHPGNLASVGIFVPSWFDNPARTSYRYLQHYVMHPFLWQYLNGGKLRSWGAKSLQESGRRGEPWLAGNGYARIGEGSGTTNVLTGSGVDEAWTTGIQLGEGVLELIRENAPYTRENLERAYVQRRRASWLAQESRVAENARNGFQRGFLTGLAGMALAGMTRGKITVHARPVPSQDRVQPVEKYFGGRIPLAEIEQIDSQCRSDGVPLHDRLMDRLGWPSIPYDGELLMSHQDALLVGGKVQGTPGFHDHVSFIDPDLCLLCHRRICVEMCSGEAIAASKENGAPAFDREKCVHCGACLWNCDNIEFAAGGGGLHSVEN